MMNSDIDDEFHDASDSNEWLIGDKIWEDRERIVSISNARTLVNNIENYTHNRQLDIWNENYNRIVRKQK